MLVKIDYENLKVGDKLFVKWISHNRVSLTFECHVSESNPSVVLLEPRSDHSGLKTMILDPTTGNILNFKAVVYPSYKAFQLANAVEAALEVITGWDRKSPLSEEVLQFALSGLNPVIEELRHGESK